MNYRQQQSLKEAAARALSHNRLSKLSEEERRKVLERMENITEDQGTTDQPDTTGDDGNPESPQRPL